MPDANGVAETVRKIVAEVLALEEAEVTPATRFYSDTGGESIEMLEVGFHVEKKLGVRVDFGRALANENLKLDSSGAFTPEALDWLRTSYPFLQVDHLGPRITPDQLKNSLTVAMIAGFVELALQGASYAEPRLSPPARTA